MSTAITAVPESVDITCYAGDSFDLTVTFVSFVPPGDATYRAHVKTSLGSAKDEEFLCTPAADGVKLHLTAAQTEALSNVAAAQAQAQPVGMVAAALAIEDEDPQYVGYWDLEMTLPTDAAVRTLVRGDFSVVPDVTDVP